MSQLRRCAVKIKQAQESIVKVAMESIAKTLGGQVTTKVSDFLARNIRGDVVAAVRWPGADFGYGVLIENGQLVVVGDPYGQKIGIKEFTDMFTQFYQTTAVQIALQKMGYTSNVTFLPNKNVMVRGVTGVPAVV